MYKQTEKLKENKNKAVASFFARRKIKMNPYCLASNDRTKLQRLNDFQHVESTTSKFEGVRQYMLKIEIPNVTTKQEIQVRYPARGFEVMQQSARDWKTNIGGVYGGWMITGSLAIALHAKKLNSRTSVKVNDLDLIVENALTATQEADKMRTKYEVPNGAQSNGTYLGDIVNKNSIDILHGDCRRAVIIEGLPVIPIDDLIEKYESRPRTADESKVELLRKLKLEDGWKK